MAKQALLPKKATLARSFETRQKPMGMAKKGGRQKFLGPLKSMKTGGSGKKKSKR
jgi:hypothetical protein